MDKRRRDNASIVMAALVVGIIVALAFIWVVNGQPQIGLGDPSSSPSVAADVSALPSVDPSTGVVRLGDPNPALTPGAVNPDVTQANIASTICKSGWTATIRPPSSYTTKLKKTQLADPRYGNTANQNTADYEEDHLISLELGGAPKDEKNLFPEPYKIPYTYQGKAIDLGAHSKDKYENYLNAMVCNGKTPLATAQHTIASDWVGGWLAAGMPSGSGSASDD